MKKDLMILPLQFFAEPGADAAADTAAPDQTTEDKPADETAKKTFSQSELDAAISRATEANRKKTEKAQQEAIQQAIKDYEAKAKMSDEERISAELKEEKTRIEADRAELEKQKFAAEVTMKVAKAGMPQYVADFVVNPPTAETLDDYLKQHKAHTDAEVNEKVKAALRQDPPKSDKGTDGKTKTDAELIAEQRNNQTKVQGFDPWAK